MALTIKNLGAGTLPTPSTASILAVAAGKSILVKNIILTNRNTSTARTVTLYTRINNVDYEITPLDLSIPAKSQVVLDSEITLQVTNSVQDELRGKASGNDVAYVINGMERDV